MLNGWSGTILTIDLTTGTVKKEPFNVDFARKWLGGEGFGAKILWDRVGPDVKDALGPDNVVIFTSGPLTGTLAPGSGRLEIVNKSPLTNIFGDSNSGGHFAPEFKNAGYDAIVIGGKAPKPVYVWIDDDQVEIRDATRLWGKTVSETDRLIKEEIRDKSIQISCIGPGGENLVKYAILMNNLDRAPGWAGSGAVAGSKNLKAVAVRGTQGVRIARAEEFLDACEKAREKVKKMASLPDMRFQGTMALVRSMYMSGVGQLYNWNVSCCPPSHLEQIAGDKWAKEFVIGNTGCYGCPMHCTHYCVIRSGPYAGLASHGFEYGAITGWIYSYGSPNLAFAMKAAQWCNDYGLDAAEPAYVIAWAVDCYKRGLITEKDTDGMSLEWADETQGLDLLRKITYREGTFGDLLAEGVGGAARRKGGGTEYYAQTIKGSFSQENPTRANYGMALSSATSTRGADHLKGFPLFERRGLSPQMGIKFWGHPGAASGLSHEGKSAMNTYYRHICTLMDCLGTCKFQSRWMYPLDGLTEEDYLALFNAATGSSFSVQDFMLAAERVYTLEHCYNVSLGMDRKDDTLPPMYFEEPLNAGPLKGHKLEKYRFEKMLDDYYKYWGWDVTTGIPTRQTLEKLGMNDVAEELGKLGRLPTG